MGRFPIFNSPSPSNCEYSPHAMDVDHEDIAAACEDLSISTPIKYVTEPVSQVNWHSFDEQQPCAMTDVVEVPVPQLSVVRRVIGVVTDAIAEIDEHTMRRIAMFPYMMSGYIQIGFNIAFPAFFFYWMYSFGQSIHSDVEKKVLLFSEEVMEQISRCSRDYLDNRCDPSTRVPALVSACQAWEECMGRDPHLVAKRSGISAEIFGETLNSFFNVLSWKAILSLIVLSVGICLIFNLTFSMNRKTQEDPPSRIRTPNKHLMLTHHTPRRTRRL